tara:strand:- start:241 stop:1392 length:1152 start_codon:yes stop_codon:yes gene_type:complete
MKILKILFFVLFFANCGYVATKFIHFNNIPKPNGEYNVGSSKFFWIDESRQEWYLDNLKNKRKLMAQIWYPAKDIGNLNALYYIERIDERVKYIAHELGVPDYLLKNISKIKSNSYLDAPSEEGLFPVILFSHGLGGMRTQNTIQAEALASRGYIVIATDHMYDSNIVLYPDGMIATNISHTDSLSENQWYEIRGKQLDFRTGDISFLIDRVEDINKGIINTSLKGKINLNKIGIFGHSYGGATSILSSIIDNRIDACLTLDAWFVPLKENILKQKYDKPFLHVGQKKWSNEMNYQKLDLFLDNCINDKYKLIVKDSKHFDFTDIPHFSNLTQRLGISGKIDKNDLKSIINELTIGFFDYHLKNINLFEPENISKQYEKLILF